MSTQVEPVTLTAFWMKNGQFDHWVMNYQGQDHPPGPYPSIEVLKGNNAEFKFTINDPLKQIVFADKDPIWVQPGGTKPTGPTGSKTKEIHDIKGEGTTVLTFKDHNWNKDALAYVINFKNAPPLDPIVDNDGGGPKFENALLYLAGLILAAGIVLLLMRPMLRRWRQAPIQPAARPGPGDERDV